MLNEMLFDAYRLHNIVICVCSAEDHCGPGIAILWVLESCFFSPSRNLYLSITTQAQETQMYTHDRLGYVPTIPVSYW